MNWSPSNSPYDIQLLGILHRSQKVAYTFGGTAILAVSGFLSRMKIRPPCSVSPYFQKKEDNNMYTVPRFVAKMAKENRNCSGYQVHG